MARLGYGEHKVSRSAKIRSIRHNFGFDSIDAQRVAERCGAGRQLTVFHNNRQAARCSDKIRLGVGVVHAPVDGLENGKKIFGISMGVWDGRQIADADRLIRKVSKTWMRTACW